MFDNTVWVCRRIVRVMRLPFGKAGDAEVEVATRWVGTSNANLRFGVSGSHKAKLLKKIADPRRVTSHNVPSM